MNLRRSASIERFLFVLKVFNYPLRGTYPSWGFFCFNATRGRGKYNLKNRRVEMTKKMKMELEKQDLDYSFQTLTFYIALIATALFLPFFVS